MKRLLTFNLENGKYVICENEKAIFSIDGVDLTFNSLEFYNGIYKDGRTTLIQFENRIQNDQFKKGSYIYQWINEIITAIRDAFNEADEEEENSAEKGSLKVIHLYELAACAGSGFFSDDAEKNWDDYEVNNTEADYAVKISGYSMEPKIPDGCIVLVKKTEGLSHNDIGIFNFNGEAMCKRYVICDRKTLLVPENKSNEYKQIEVSENDTFTTQGKVIDIIDENVAK